MSEIGQIRKAIREGNYLVSDHAIEEVEADGLWLREIIDVLKSGELDSTYTDDPRGTRYVVQGMVDDEEVDVVCRFNRDGKLVIITVYKVDQ